MDANSIERIKVAVCVAVATAIFLEVERMKPSRARDLRVRIAADAIDRTSPFPMFYTLYQSRPAGEAEPFFLMRHLDYLNLLDARQWPKPKVRVMERAEYTRVMAGLDAFIVKGLGETPYSAQERKDVGAMLLRISVAHPWLPEEYLPVLRQHRLDVEGAKA